MSLSHLFKFKRVGGVRFLRIGRVNFTWSVAKPISSPAERTPKRSRRAITAAAYERGLIHGIHKGAMVERDVTAAFLSLRGDKPVYADH